MVHSYLTYCNIIWGNASLIALQKLTVLQKRAIRIICRAKFLAATSPLFRKQNILKLSDINKLQMAMFVYKTQNGLLPASCSIYVNAYSSSHQYMLRNHPSVATVSFRTKTRERFIDVAGAKLWNSLPDSICDSNSLLLLKKKLTTFLLDMYN